MNNKRGIALILTLGFLVLILSMGLSFMRYTILRNEHASSLHNLLKARLNAEKAFSETLYQVNSFFKKDPMAIVSNDEKWFQGTKEDDFSVKIIDLSGKLNINGSADQISLPTILDHMLMSENCPEGILFNQEKEESFLREKKRFGSVQELGICVDANRAKWVDFLMDHLTPWGLSFYQTPEGEKQWNLWDQCSIQDDVSLPSLGKHKNKFSELYGQGVDGVEIFNRLISYISTGDAVSNSPQMSADFFKKAPSLYINEVCYETSKVDAYFNKKNASDTNGGEFIEIFNPYKIPIELKGYTLSFGSKKKGKVTINLPDRTLLPNSFLVVTDTTKRLQNLEQVSPDMIYEHKDFEINREKITLSKGDFKDVFDLSLDVEVDKSVTKDDPRSNHPSNYEEGFSPGKTNRIFGQGLSKNFFWKERLSFALWDELYDLKKPLSFLPYVYKGESPWDYLQVTSQAVFDENNDGILQDEEAKDFVLLQYLSCRNDKENVSESCAGRVNINTASAFVLEALPGINDITAKAIVAYREKYFSSKTKRKKKGFENIYDIILPLKTCLSNEEVDRVFWEIQNLIKVRTHTFRIIVKGFCEDMIYEIQADIEQPVTFDEEGSAVISGRPDVKSSMIRHFLVLKR